MSRSFHSSVAPLAASLYHRLMSSFKSTLKLCDLFTCCGLCSFVGPLYLYTLVSFVWPEWKLWSLLLLNVRMKGPWRPSCLTSLKGKRRDSVYRIRGTSVAWTQVLVPVSPLNIYRHFLLSFSMKIILFLSEATELMCRVFPTCSSYSSTDFSVIWK